MDYTPTQMFIYYGCKFKYFTVKFEPEKLGWWMSAGIDLLAILPFIGLLKYLDDTSTGFKSMKKAFVNSKDGIEDSIRHLLQNVPDNLKKITPIQVFTKHFAPLRKGVKETLEETGQKSDDLLENIQAIDKKVDINDVAKEVGEGGNAVLKVDELVVRDSKFLDTEGKLIGINGHQMEVVYQAR